MHNPKDILVITTSGTSDLKIKQYLKPVSVNIASGINIFNDFFSEIRDIFGGRSSVYRNQMNSLYKEALEKIKIAAYELGANGIIGLSIDIDEISGKTKNMLMISAIGTAVIFEKDVIAPLNTEDKFENVSVEKVNMLRSKKILIERANANNLELNDDVWDFVINNAVVELAPFIMKRFSETLAADTLNQEIAKNFTTKVGHYLDSLTDEDRMDVLYNEIKATTDEKKKMKLAELANDLNMYDHGRVMQMLQDTDFNNQRMGVRIATYDKPHFNKQDIIELEKVKDHIRNFFPERGARTSKKQLLSSKEKEVWGCECGKTNDIDMYCSGCQKDIYGFKYGDIKPSVAATYIEQKIELVKEFLL